MPAYHAPIDEATEADRVMCRVPGCAKNLTAMNDAEVDWLTVRCRVHRLCRDCDEWYDGERCPTCSVCRHHGLPLEPDGYGGYARNCDECSPEVTTTFDAALAASLAR